MSFLRDFIAAAIPATGSKTAYYSKPDRMSDSFELRRLLAPPDSQHPQTEFYEYYWAHHMSGNRLGHLLPLIRVLMLRLPWRIAGSLRLLWLLAWLVVVALGIAAFSFGAELLVEDPTVVLTGFGVGAAAASVAVFLGGVVLRWVAGTFVDVARYIDPRPQNIAVRHTIRAEAVRFLRKLHESGRYERIVVVGHSLGSIIGYDVVSFLWAEMNQCHGRPADVHQEALADVEAIAGELEQGAGSLKEYRVAQRRLWAEQRSKGNPWLISDFVSLGSPLAHAAMLLAEDAAHLRERQDLRELPRCPPIPEREGFAFDSLEYAPVAGGGGDFVLRLLHHAAQFAPTRWTNIWFPARYGVFGDWFGGPLRPLFGPGVRDVPITNGSRARLVPVFPHTWYFRWVAPTTDPDTAQGALRAALDLNSWSWLSKVRELPSDPDTCAPG